MFRKEKYYTVEIEGGNIKAVSDKISDKDEAQNLQAACHERQAVCISAVKEKKKTGALADAQRAVDAAKADTGVAADKLTGSQTMKPGVGHWPISNARLAFTSARGASFDRGRRRLPRGRYRR